MIKKGNLFGIVALFATVFASAQKGYDGKRGMEGLVDIMFLEASYGYNMGVTPTNIPSSEYSRFGTYSVGVQFQIDELLGFRTTYTNSVFQHQTLPDLGVSFNKFTAEATANIRTLYLLAPPEFDFIAHAGFGANFGKSHSLDKTDNMLSLQIGFMPRYNISNTIGIFFDLTYTYNLLQNRGFDGKAFNGTSGSYLVPSLGVSFYFGGY